MKGNADALAHLLTHMMLFLMPYSLYRELVLHVSAPDDFLYQEKVRFYFDLSAFDTNERKVRHFFETRLKLLLEKLDAKGYVDEKQVGVEVPLKIKELGNRRHYRLPDIRMLGKKVLLICENPLITATIAKMFRYFLYEVDEGAEAYKKRGSNLAAYDIFVLDKTLYNDGIRRLVTQVRLHKDLKFVLITKAVSNETTPDPLVSAYLVKPVMQESIFELIISLYEEDAKKKRIDINDDIEVIDMERYIDTAFERSEKAYIDMLKKQHSHKHLFDESDVELPDLAIGEVDWDALAVLDRSVGKERCKEMHCNYIEALRKFLDKFNRSDYYFREIAMGKSAVQTKEFAIDLEKSAHLIGAERMEQLAKLIEMMFVYGKLDEMKVFVNRYHLELKKLIVEISRVLKVEKDGES
jgi:hypothetical protein